jgi:hypothetical protein
MSSPKQPGADYTERLRRLAIRIVEGDDEACYHLMTLGWVSGYTFARFLALTNAYRSLRRHPERERWLAEARASDAPTAPRVRALDVVAVPT